MRTLLSFAFVLFMAPLAAQEPPPPPESSPGDYLLAPGDVLRITVADEPQLSGTQFRVDTDGTFSYPLLVRIEARGKTTRQLQAEITTRLADGWVRRPVVTVEMEQYRPQGVYVMGEVRTPAMYPMQGQMTLLEAIAKAGYVTPGAGTEAMILRQPPGQSGPQTPAAAKDGRQIRVSLVDLLEGRSSANIELRDGDTVIVLKAEKFYVSGHVKSPGQYTWEPNLTVRAAIILAGGISDKGSSRRIRIIRTVTEKGQSVERRLDADQNDPVLPGDTVEVQQRLL